MKMKSHSNGWFTSGDVNGMVTEKTFFYPLCFSDGWENILVSGYSYYLSRRSLKPPNKTMVVFDMFHQEVESIFLDMK